MKLTLVEWSLVAASGAALALGGYLGWRRWRRQVAARALLARLQAVSVDLVQAVLVPDASGGQIHCDFVLLTPGGLLVVDLRDVPGVIFGGRHMDEWTVMDGHQRRTFANPIEPLHDRVAAVKQLAGEAPVEGRIVFTARARFPKGLPPLVAMLDALDGAFPPARGHEAEAERWRDAFLAVKAASRPSPLARS
ncbi:MAG: NERD domain-containing protein [Steroidobacteraceae bacterium]|jgi:hypothetical protein|nr:NERD domain-containing protein [Steroidobacteraceae bacterium]